MSSEPPPFDDAFVDLMLAPQTAIDLIVTFVGAFLAFLGAAALLSLQLSHDRRIFADQLSADRENRGAERRADTARTLGRELLASAEELQTSTDHALGESLMTSATVDFTDVVPGASRMHAAHRAAATELDLDASIPQLWQARLRWWRAVGHAARSASFRGVARKDRSVIIGALLRHRLETIDDTIRLLASRLIRWDGGVVRDPGSRRLRVSGQRRPPSLGAIERLNLQVLTDTDADATRQARQSLARMIEVARGSRRRARPTEGGP